MSFDWNQYLLLAKRLANETADEAALRSAVSRAYYCAFNLAAARAAENRCRLSPSGGSHEKVWTLYAESEDLGCQRLGAIGPRLKRRRVIADYRSQFGLDEVAGAMEDAEECITIIESLARQFPRNTPRVQPVR